MQEVHEAAALFLAENGALYPDKLICSGVLPEQFSAQPCPPAHNGRFPGTALLDAGHPQYSTDKGKPDDLCPPRAKQNLANSNYWQSHLGTFPQHRRRAT